MSYILHAYVADFPYVKRECGDQNLDGYALERFCRMATGLLPNEHWSSMRMSWFDTVDDSLIAAGAPRRLSRFFNRGAPVAIQEAEDFPLVGMIEPAEKELLASELHAALASGRLPSNVAAAVAEVRGWIACALDPSEGIVTFYY